MTRRTGRVVAVLSASVALAAAAAMRQDRPAPFDHPSHAKLFVTCTSCHVGTEEAGAALLPTPESCAACHDGTVHRRTDWRPRVGPRPSNLRFDHVGHATVRRERGDTAQSCADCHAERTNPWMTIRGPSAPQCLSCHRVEAEHLTVPDTTCATCHLPLARADALTRDRIARFPAPPTHRAPVFMRTGGHGVQAKSAQSCSTCHARDFCAACHVNAPETPAIQALAPDPRSLAIPHQLKAPVGHADRTFERAHGAAAGKAGAACGTCHTKESCFACHSGEAPRPVLGLHQAGPGRGAGAATTRRPPTNHVAGWEGRHGPVASAAMRTCTSCHIRDSCLECHRPDASRRDGYHPSGYLTRHPADAYNRTGSCSDCHNQGEFCQSCHKQSGLSSRRTLLGPGGYHDGNRQFGLGHGQAARQALESCASCHVERECLTCHSVVRGRGFSPHGPGFDPARLLRKNPQLCIACHGTAIPQR
ncbi:MAG: cytochrome c3 family protein [Gemmatimonadales bacterium]|nr:cytochrome c3 family protein [Gemmatimonadales bacterium]